MRRRKIIVAVIVLLCLGGFFAWRMTHERDPRLVGAWLERDGRWATADELERAANRGRLYAKTGRTFMTVWTLQGDGSGSVTKLLTPGAGACRWQTQGDRLYVAYDSRALTRREKLVELWETLSGERPRRWHEYRYLVEGSGRVRLELGDPAQRPSYWVNLTRIEQPGE